MKKLILTCFFIFLLISCAKKVMVTDTEYIRSQAFNSDEFKELQFAYEKYLEYGKTHNTATAMKMYKDKPFLKDTIIHYSNMRDSLNNVLKSKSDIFYSIYPTKSLKISPDDFKSLLIKN